MSGTVTVSDIIRALEAQLITRKEARIALRMLGFQLEKVEL